MRASWDDIGSINLACFSMMGGSRAHGENPRELMEIVQTQHKRAIPGFESMAVLL